MPRTDIHLDAMLRHLGAAYYESLHGRADRSDVARALDSVEEHLKEHPVTPAQRTVPPQTRPARPARPAAADGQADHHHRRYARRVRDVMTVNVVTVDRITPYKEIARMLTEHRVSGLPVLTMGRHVAGVVSEADLIAAEDKEARRARAAAAAGRRRWVRRGAAHPALIAGDLMTSPAITIHPDATIPAAARVMHAHHVRRLPVIDPDGKLIGVVSRRDLLSVFLRPDAEIADDAQAVLDEILLASPGDAAVAVHNGVVLLTGTLNPADGDDGDLVPLAIKLLWDIDGVVDVVNHLGAAPAAARTRPAAAEEEGPEAPAANA